MRFFFAKRSGVHRLACLSLYRSLLRAIAYQSSTYQSTIQTVIQGRFRRDSSLQSPKAILTAVENGSLVALQYLTTPSKVSKEIIERLTTNISNALPPRCFLQLQASKPRVWPHPGGIPVLDARPRPREALAHGKKRFIPILVNGMGVPFLRFKRPQSPYLSRIIRNKQKRRQKRFDLSLKLQEELRFAEDEDRWDEILSQELFSCKPTNQKEGPSLDPPNLQSSRQTAQELAIYSIRLSPLEGLWADALNEEIDALKKKFLEDKRRTIIMAERMWRIVKKERALKAAEEGVEAVKHDDLMKGRGLSATVRRYRGNLQKKNTRS